MNRFKKALTAMDHKNQGRRRLKQLLDKMLIAIAARMGIAAFCLWATLLSLISPPSPADEVPAQERTT